RDLPWSLALPASGGPPNTTERCRPFAQSAFTDLTATTSDSAPVLRLDTCTLAETFHSGSSLSIGITGSHVPHQSLIRTHATFMPDAAQPVNRHPLGSIPGQPSIPVSTPSVKLTTCHRWFTCVRLPESHLPRSWQRLFLRRSPRRLLTDAARGGLETDPAVRFRGAVPHLCCSWRPVFTGRARDTRRPLLYPE
ncbi:MAG: hypothetical protein RL701_4377, partial [Pseudomonadota bacterium]